ncbi:MAG: cytidine deaminase [Christensenellaceae bacterium]|jgi:cytidine deaminase
MEMLSGQDHELLQYAADAIVKNYDGINRLHTVGGAVRCKNGKIYTGINVYDLHGTCAEIIAMGQALTEGEREFTEIVAVRGEKGEEVISPCGNCRQMLLTYAPNCNVIIATENGLRKIPAKELLPFPY